MRGRGKRWEREHAQLASGARTRARERENEREQERERASERESEHESERESELETGGRAMAGESEIERSKWGAGALALWGRT